MKPAVLVTGASGFVGRWVVKNLRDRGDRVFPLEHRWSSPEDLERQLGDGLIDRCIHLGWHAAPGDYLTNVDANLVSLHNTVALARILHARGCRRLVVAGTSAEYAPSSAPLRESDPVAPWSVYGASKAAAALLLSSSLVPDAPSVSWARIFNVTGPGEAAERILPSVASAAYRTTPIALSDGLQVRDFLDVRDVAAALAHLSVVEHAGPVNVCSGEAVTLQRILGAVAARLGNTEVLEWGNRTRSVTDPDRVVGDNALLRGLGWQRTYDFDRLVAEVAKYWLLEFRKADQARTGR